MTFPRAANTSTAPAEPALFAIDVKLVYSASGSLINSFDKAPGFHPDGCIGGFAVGAGGKLYAAQNVANRIKVYDILTPEVSSFSNIFRFSLL